MKKTHESQVSFQSYSENFQIAFEVCQKAKAQFVCGNDIIPQSELPVIFDPSISNIFRTTFNLQDEMYEAVKSGNFDKIRKIEEHLNKIDKLREQFGTNCVALYGDYGHNLRKARAYLDRIANQHNISKCSTDVATTYFGVGEGQESAAFTMYELLKKNRTNFASILLQGTLNTKGSTQTYLHNIVLLGSEFPERGPIESLNQLPDDVVVIDPYLNHVGQANTYLRDQKPYLSAFNFTDIPDLAVNNLTASVLEKTQLQIDLLVEEGKRMGLTKFNDRELFLSPRSKLCKDDNVTRLNEYVARVYPDLSTKFFGMSYTNDERVAAVAEIKSLENAAVCIDLNQKFNMGYFSRGLKHTLFTFTDASRLPTEINMPLKTTP